MLGVSLMDAYIARLETVERRHPLLGAKHVILAVGDLGDLTLRDLQLLQLEHDRVFHPDVYGLSKAAQLHHYTLHIAKLTGYLAAASEDASLWADFESRRLPDLLLFGLKVSTVANEPLDAELLAEKLLLTDA